MSWLSRLLAVSALVLLAAGIAVGVQRARFVATAQAVEGTVSAVEARNARCGNKARRRCTRFTAIVDYTHSGASGQVRLGAGRMRGRNEPVTEADWQVGDTVPLRIAPATGEVRAATTTGLWGLPMALVLGGLVAGTSAALLAKGRRRTT